MSKILHHSDDDGRCAGFIAYQYIIDGRDTLTPADFIEYNYAGNLNTRYPKIVYGETVYIVDLSLCDEIYEFIKYVIEHDGKVVHIDHHASGIEYYNAFRSKLKAWIDNGSYTAFMRNGISGAMLCWIYATVFNSDDRAHPDLALFDFDDDDLRYKACRIDDKGNPIDKNGNKIDPESRSIPKIPDVVRFIDDNDLFKNKITETPAFRWGFTLYQKNPLNYIWIDLFDDSNYYKQNALIDSIMKSGDTIISYKNRTDARILNNGFICHVNGVEVVFVNAPDGNSTIFQEMYDNCDAVCKFSYDGTKWWFTFYSKTEGGADCKALVDWLKEQYAESDGFVSGGGHVHAAGSTWKKNILEHFKIEKQEFIDKRRNIKIELEVAAEEKRLKEEEARVKAEQEKLAAIRAKVAARQAEDYGI